MRKVLFFLGVLNDEDIDWMVSAGTRRKLPAGTVLIHEGRPLDAIHLLLDGSLSVSLQSRGGREIARLQSGEFVGEVSFVDSRPPSATVTAAEDSLVLSLPRSELGDKLEREPPFAARFYRALALFLSARLRATTNRLGYGDGTPGEAAAPGDADEMEASVLENVGVAGARFNWMLRQLRES